MEIRTLGDYQRLKAEGYSFQVKDGTLHTQNKVARFFTAIAEKMSFLSPAVAADVRVRTGMLETLDAKLQQLQFRQAHGISKPMQALPTDPSATLSLETDIRTILKHVNILKGTEARGVQEPNAVITTLTRENIRPGTLLKQGMNTCFIVSMINALMTTESGCEILRNRLDENGRLTMPNGDPAPARSRSLFSPMVSDFEGSCIAVFNALHKVNCEAKGEPVPPDEIAKEGSQFDAHLFVKTVFPELTSGVGILSALQASRGISQQEAKAFQASLKPEMRLSEDDLRDLRNTGLSNDQVKSTMAARAAEYLQAGYCGYYYQPNPTGSGGHYMTVVGATDDGRLVVRDSLNGKEYTKDITLHGGKNSSVFFFKPRSEMTQDEIAAENPEPRKKVKQNPAQQVKPQAEFTVERGAGALPDIQEVGAEAEID